MIKRAAAAAIGGALAVAAVPAVLGAVGFTGAGIAASSLAAKLMAPPLAPSAQSRALGDSGPREGIHVGSLGLRPSEGVPAIAPFLTSPSFCPTGAAGLSTSSNILLGSVGSAFGALLGGAKRASPSPPPGGSRPEGEQPGENVPQVEPPKPPLEPEKHEK
nr:PREDICTED: interferon alpha-inducible protein 27-like protein 2 [Bos mutus]